MIAYISSRPINKRESFTLNEINEINRSGMEIIVFVLSNTPCDSELGKLTEYANILSIKMLKAHLSYLFSAPVLYFKTLSGLAGRDALKSFYIFIKSVYIARRIEELKIAHIHSPWASSGATAGLIISRLTNISFSFTAHAWDLFCGCSMLSEKVRETSFVIAISEYNKRYIIEKTGVECAGKIHVIHCGINLPEFPYKDMDRKSKNILSIATFTEKKGTKYLLEAVHLLRHKGMSINLTIAGECSDYKEERYKQMLESYVKRNNLEKNVSVIERASRPQIVNLLQVSGALVLPSIITEKGDRDGVPVVLMEAMASGLPVVSTGVSGIPELIVDNETGILANSSDPVDLAKKIHFLFNNGRLQEKLRKNARVKIEREFDAGKNSNRLKELFTACMGDN